jgi:hypothetical protein
MVDEQSGMLDSLGPSLQTYKATKELDRITSNGYKPLRHITNIITAQRLKNFKDRLSDAGFEVHLCTLPLYPSDAHTANALARGMVRTHCMYTVWILQHVLQYVYYIMYLYFFLLPITCVSPLSYLSLPPLCILPPPRPRTASTTSWSTSAQLASTTTSTAP